MRHFFTAIALIIVLSAVSQDTWIRRYGGNGLDTGHSVLRLASGDLVCVGTTSSDGNGLSDGVVFRVASSSEVLWTKTIGTDHVDNLTGACLNVDGSIAVIGATKGSGFGSYDMLVATLSENGEILNQNVLGNSEWNFGKAIVEHPDGGWIVLGETLAEDILGKQATIARIDSDLNIVWQHAFGDVGDDSFNDVIIDSFGSILVGGFQSIAGDQEAWLLSFDNDGAILWEENYGTLEEDSIEELYLFPNGDIAASGYSWVDSGGGHDFMVMRLDPAGTIIWERILGGPEKDEMYGLAVKDNGRVISCGSSVSDIGNGGLEIFLYEVTENGVFIYLKTYGGALDDTAKDLVLDGLGGQTVIGHSNSYNFGFDDIILLQTDAEGAIENEADVEYFSWDNIGIITSINDQLEQSQPIVFMDGQYLTSVSHSIISVELYDYSGRLVFSSSESGPHIKIPSTIKGLVIANCILMSENGKSVRNRSWQKI